MRKRYYAAGLLFLTLLAACGKQETKPDQEVGTITGAVDTPTPQSGTVSENENTPTPVPENTPTPVPENTPTPEPYTGEFDWYTLNHIPTAAEIAELAIPLPEAEENAYVKIWGSEGAQVWDGTDYRAVYLVCELESVDSTEEVFENYKGWMVTADTVFLLDETWEEDAAQTIYRELTQEEFSKVLEEQIYVYAWCGYKDTKVQYVIARVPEAGEAVAKQAVPTILPEEAQYFKEMNPYPHEEFIESFPYDLPEIERYEFLRVQETGKEGICLAWEGATSQGGNPLYNKPFEIKELYVYEINQDTLFFLEGMFFRDYSYPYFLGGLGDFYESEIVNGMCGIRGNQILFVFEYLGS